MDYYAFIIPCVNWIATLLLIIKLQIFMNVFINFTFLSESFMSYILRMFFTKFVFLFMKCENSTAFTKNCKYFYQGYNIQKPENTNSCINSNPQNKLTIKV
ncbi:transmembrane protein, putative (macronuclear) [Tetrahymena thermophila SB210]|uniref:Transmembrane protein, putative n=1 Tax=Tetrahymena thermophila (strain SB210) TaxID=312017 RepID=W7XF05_TETTS|nr:transmembrane protein, putative [Tetrahymena thermophila SB210]EWS76377.1 transmembrane protein, putative [Tetrahymena thermophila SB210]|eukprot:XP_012651161.1 transmembrane protein, putative [Tetrahymena thermophila SB210]